MPGTDTITEGDVTPVSSLQELTPGSLQPHPLNPRVDTADVADLADSIRAKGLLHPIVVVPANAKGKFRIIAGHRRHAAAKSVGLKRIPCIVRTDLTDDADQLAAMLLENTERTDLNVVEEASAVQGLLDLGDSMKAAANRTGMSAKRIRDRVKVAGMSDELKTRLVRHNVTLEDALFIATHSDDLADAEFLEAKLGTNDWPFAKERVAENVAKRKKIAKLAKDIEASDLELITGPGIATWKAAHGITDAGFTTEQIPWTTVEATRQYAPTEAFVILGYDESTATIYRYRAVDRVLPGDREPTPPSTPSSDTTTDSGSRADDERGAAPAPTPEAPAREPALSPVEVERQRVEADLATAHTVRSEHIAGVVVQRDDAVALAMLKPAACWLVEDYFASGREGPLLNASDEANLKDRINASTSLAEVAMVVGVLGLSDTHQDLRKADHWVDPHAYGYTQYVELLGGPLGYEWSSIELEMMEKRRAELEPTTDDAQDPEPAADSPSDDNDGDTEAETPAGPDGE